MLSPERHRHPRHPPPPQPPPPPHLPPQPNHVVATIENLPAEGGGARSGISAPSNGVRQRIRKVLNRDLLLSVALGQVLSLLICGIGLTSKYLSEDFHANTPVFQSFLNYILLFLVYTTTLAVRQGEENLLAILKRRWWKYMILGIVDIEANYLVVKAYQYTTLTSVQLLDCFVIPVVILLSWFFLLVRYKAVHFIGIVVCILGMGCMAGADVLVGRQQGAGENKLIGDLLVLGGATLYGISNVCEEYIVRNLSRVEFLGMIGLFGSFFSGIQLAIMEHKELLKVPWDWQIGLLYVGFSACMFGLYSFMPVVIKKTSATAVNLSLLTADLYSLFCGLFLFHYKGKFILPELVPSTHEAERALHHHHLVKCSSLKFFRKHQSININILCTFSFMLFICYLYVICITRVSPLFSLAEVLIRRRPLLELDRKTFT